MFKRKIEARDVINFLAGREIEFDIRQIIRVKSDWLAYAFLFYLIFLAWLMIYAFVGKAYAMVLIEGPIYGLKHTIREFILYLGDSMHDNVMKWIWWGKIILFQATFIGPWFWFKEFGKNLSPVASLGWVRFRRETMFDLKDKENAWNIVLNIRVFLNYILYIIVFLCRYIADITMWFPYLGLYYWLLKPSAILSHFVLSYSWWFGPLIKIIIWSGTFKYVFIIWFLWRYFLWIHTIEFQHVWYELISFFSSTNDLTLTYVTTYDLEKVSSSINLYNFIYYIMAVVGLNDVIIFNNPKVLKLKKINLYNFICFFIGKDIYSYRKPYRRLKINIYKLYVWHMRVFFARIFYFIFGSMALYMMCFACFAAGVSEISGFDSTFNRWVSYFSLAFIGYQVAIDKDKVYREYLDDYVPEKELSFSIFDDMYDDLKKLEGSRIRIYLKPPNNNISFPIENLSFNFKLFKINTFGVLFWKRWYVVLININFYIPIAIWTLYYVEDYFVDHTILPYFYYFSVLYDLDYLLYFYEHSTNTTSYLYNNIFFIFNTFIDIKLSIPEFFFLFNLLIFICFIYYYYYFNNNNIYYLSFIKKFLVLITVDLKKYHIQYYHEPYVVKTVFFRVLFNHINFKYKIYLIYQIVYFIWLVKKKLKINIPIEKKIFSMDFWNIPIINNIIINFSIINHLMLISIYLAHLDFNWYFLFNFQIENNLITLLLKIFIILLSILILLFFKVQLISVRIFNWEFFLIYNFNILSLLFIISCYDLIILFFCIEFYSLCIYILISFKQYSLYSTEAGLKYFIMSSISGIIFLFGVLLFYIQLGTTNFNDIFYIFSCENQRTEFLKYYNSNMNYNIFNDFLLSFNYNKNIDKIYFFNYVFEEFNFFNNISLNKDYILIFAVLLINISLFFKLNIAPFHLWIIDIYDGAPLVIMFFLNIIPKIVFFYILIKLYYNIFYIFSHDLTKLFLTLSIISFIIGSIGGLYQMRLKKLLIYSMIYNNGYFISILLTPSLLNIASLFYFLIVYIFNLLAFFICFLNLRSLITNKQYTNIYSLINLFRSNSFLAVSFVFLLFSLSGIPPFIGFLSKFYLLYNSFHNTTFLIIWISFFTSVLNTFYYIRLIKILYFMKTDIILSYRLTTFELNIILFIILFSLVFLFITPSFFFNLIKFYFIVYFKSV